ncbi:SUN domain-containing protein 3-like [Columba livia]|uniref:SUN domain-containing protein 3-like n=1 Tax=Columba livia TaxID=8932 RepID=A0A2I0LLR9_COLLI|nr:SUN domain-containing protein 3-like [Columba livia]
MRKKFTIREDFLPVMNYMRSPELILETDNHPGNCWPFPGSQGHIFIKLCMPVIPRAVTMDHVSGTVFHGESISGAPKNFAVYNELPGFVNYIRLQVQSNWGHLNYTCLYQFGVHGDPHKDGVDIPVSFSNKFH